MKVLIIGGGAREHALAWRLQQENPSVELVVAPGNAGVAALARCVPVSATDLPGLLSLGQTERPDYTLVGPEAPLALGIVDRFQRAGLAIFGPTQAAAQIESSKAFAKEIMREAKVPTARSELFTDFDAAIGASGAFGDTPVIKASGLAAGKGVVVSGSVAEAQDAIRSMLVTGSLGDAGKEILIEERLEGEEVSVFGITDGTHVVPLTPAQDHKRLLDGDAGPNTGGMGAYAPYAGPNLAVDEVVKDIMEPVLEVLRDRGTPFTGLLYAGLMLTPKGPYVIEFNCRFGDPETEAIVGVERAQLSELLKAVAAGDSLPDKNPLLPPAGRAVTTVLAAAGYPQAPKLGDEITLPLVQPEGVYVFHAGTERGADGKLRTAGGRVLAITAVRSTLEEAKRASLDYAMRVEFAGKQFRSDIGARARTP